MQKVKLLLLIYDRNTIPYCPGSIFDVVDPPDSHKEHYPNDDKNAWVMLDNGQLKRLVRQMGLIQFEFITN